MRAELAAVLLVIAGCSEASPSGSPPSPELTEPRTPGVADARTPRELLPQSLDPPWEVVPLDPQPAPWQFDAWATDLQIAVVFDAALALTRYEGEHSVGITVFQSDSGVDGPSFARSWVAAYACDEPEDVAIAGVAVTAVRAQVNCWPHYLLVFRDQLVVIADGPNMTERELEPSAFASLVRAIMDQAD